VAANCPHHTYSAANSKRNCYRNFYGKANDHSYGNVHASYERYAHGYSNPDVPPNQSATPTSTATPTATARPTPTPREALTPRPRPSPPPRP
jgi:hypothetical protein